MKPYRIEWSPDGEIVSIHLECDPMTRPHVVAIPTEELQEAVAVARSRQLGADARGDL